MKKKQWLHLEFILHLSFWVFLFSIFMLIYLEVLPIKQCLQRAISNVFLMAVLFYFNAKVLKTYLLDSKRPLLFTFYAVAAFLLIAYTRGTINLQFPQVEDNLVTADNPAGVYLAAAMTSLGVLALSTFYYLLKDRYIEDRRKLQIISERNEAELKFLKNQINPHFLFNTLNNIYSLAVVRSEKTAEMVLRLSKLLRYVIYDSQEEKVPLAKEIAFIEKFIALYQMRSEKTLDIQFLIDGITDNLQLEPLLLNPLVENCFKHGDFETNPMAFAKFVLKIKNNRLTFLTQNTSNPDDQQKDTSSGVGLGNIRRQLELKYPNRFILETEKLANLFNVKLQIELNHDNYKNTAS